MKTTIAKTFIILCDYDSSTRYIRYKSVSDKSGKINFFLNLVHNASDASKFVNLENTKHKAHRIMKKYNLENVRILDEKIGKYYYIKENE